MGATAGHQRRNDAARKGGVTSMRRERGRGRRGGFTLIEVLAALAIACVIIIATAALIRDVAFHFDRGARGVGEAERLMLAVERLSADFGSARVVPRST